LIQSVICMARVLIQSATARVIALPVDEEAMCVGLFVL